LRRLYRFYGVNRVCDFDPLYHKLSQQRPADFQSEIESQRAFRLLNRPIVIIVIAAISACEVNSRGVACFDNAPNFRFRYADRPHRWSHGRNSTL
jgi:hypothetical protein